MSDKDKTAELEQIAIIKRNETLLPPRITRFFTCQMLLMTATAVVVRAAQPSQDPSLSNQAPELTLRQASGMLMPSASLNAELANTKRYAVPGEPFVALDQTTLEKLSTGASCDSPVYQLWREP